MIPCNVLGKVQDLFRNLFLEAQPPVVIQMFDVHMVITHTSYLRRGDAISVSGAEVGEGQDIFKWQAKRSSDFEVIDLFFAVQPDFGTAVFDLPEDQPVRGNNKEVVHLHHTVSEQL